MQDISVSVVGGVIELDCSDFDLGDDAIAECSGALTQLLTHLLLASEAKAILEDSTLQERTAGISAQDMIVQASILNAEYQAGVLLEITSGRASIADHGFPEFRGETAVDV
jgi:hypothetical protein